MIATVPYEPLVFVRTTFFANFLATGRQRRMHLLKTI